MRGRSGGGGGGKTSVVKSKCAAEIGAIEPMGRMNERTRRKEAEKGKVFRSEKDLESEGGWRAGIEKAERGLVKRHLEAET